MNLFICSLLILLFLVFRLDKINEQINNIQTDTLTYLHDSQLPPPGSVIMDSYLGLRLKLTLKDSSIAEGTVQSINDSTQKLSLIDGKLFFLVL